MRLFPALAASLLISLGSVAMAAPQSALTFTGSGLTGAGADTTRGYGFTVTGSNLVAAQLGVWDEGGDGLAESHQVGLWNSTGTLLASVTVGSGTSAALVDGFRYVDIVDVPLAVGSYTVGAFFIGGSQDPQALALVGLATAPGITYDVLRYINFVPSLTMPTTTSPLDGITGLIGGTLMVDAITAPASEVPEPQSALLALMGVGLLSLARARRR
ncbi:MAG: PEP-CTERM sorting domain-containing protein [Burkholderiaceae bacterium]|nr:PEP-CTERM sorting domain-containing protein [Burkholderiaceae bacterium]